MSDPKATVVVMEHYDRPGRMNTEMFEAALAASAWSAPCLQIDDPTATVGGA